MKWNKIVTIGLLLITCQNFISQVRIQIKSLPKDTPIDAKIYAAGSFNDWKPDDVRFEFQPNSNNQLELILPKVDLPSLEYKVTLGSWDSVEGDHNEHAISNRIIDNPKNQELEISVLSWQKTKELKSTASRNVHVLNENFEIPQLNTKRRIWIYLPEDYSTTKKKYPVIYMHDGQNLFDELTAYSGEWKIDETLDQLFKKKKSFIVVGIDHGEDERINDYGPWNNPKYGGGNGKLYADFLANTLKPYIDKHYRTLSSAKNTGLIGSSLGGLISLYTGIEYPTKFGKLGVFSPSTWFTKVQLFEFLNHQTKRDIKSKFYLYGGHLEGDHLIEDLDEVSQTLQQKGISKKNIIINTEKSGTHKEEFWAKEFPKAIDWLFFK